MPLSLHISNLHGTPDFLTLSSAYPGDLMSVSRPHQPAFVAARCGAHSMNLPQRAGAAQRKVAMRAPLRPRRTTRLGTGVDDLPHDAGGHADRRRAGTAPLDSL